MPDDDPKKLGEEIRQEEHLARVRDYGAADAATYPDRVAEGAAMLARDAAATQAERISGEAELETLVSRAEASWPARCPGERQPSPAPPEPDSPSQGRRKGR